MPVGVVVNPVAGGGRMARLWPEIRTALETRLGPLRIERTTEIGDACTLARALAVTGCDMVVAVGGDGTISETVDGLIHAQSIDRASAQLGVVPVGTGSDFSRMLDLGGDLDAMAAGLASGRSRRLDAGRVCYIDDHGALHSRHFINIASVGLSGPTARAVNRARRGSRLPGKALFFWHTVVELIRYRFDDVRVTVDDGDAIEGRIALVAVANGRYFGGGMMIAPDAELDDGLVEVVMVNARSKFELLRDLRFVYSGAHRGLPSCRFLRGRKITIEPVGIEVDDAALIDIDGESPGRIPAQFEVLPGALSLRY